MKRRNLGQPENQKDLNAIVLIKNESGKAVQRQQQNKSESRSKKVLSKTISPPTRIATNLNKDIQPKMQSLYLVCQLEKLITTQEWPQ